MSGDVAENHSSEEHGGDENDGDENDAIMRSVLAHVDRETEHSYMQAALRLREFEELPDAAVPVLKTLADVEFRSVRIAARDVLKAHGHDLDTADAARQTEARALGRGNALLAIVSLGSAGTGILITALSFLNFYTFKHFPFPEPVQVLFWANAFFTLPFLIVATLMVFPGRAPRIIAAATALTALVAATIFMMTAQMLFQDYWAYQFTAKVAESYTAFLSPFRVGLMMLPIIVGQSITLVYVSNTRILDRES